MNPQKHPVTSVLFDIDNVLIDTRLSYLTAIRWAVGIYLTDSKVPFFLPSKKRRAVDIISAEDVGRFKLLGGFNDDWDCCYGILVYLLSLPVKKKTVDELRRVIDFKGFTAKVKTRPLRASGIVKMLGRNPGVMIEKISRIFQEVYLGKDLFEMQERKNALYWKRSGLIHKEKLIFRKSTLEKIKARGIKIGIATGRSRFEANYALRHFGILDLIDAMTTIDDVRKAEREAKCSLRKPHPYSILETAAKLGSQNKFLYIGDLPDDILAANQAKESLDIRSVGFPTYASDPETAAKDLITSRSAYLIQKPSDLLVLLNRSEL